MSPKLVPLIYKNLQKNHLLNFFVFKIHCNALNTMSRFLIESIDTSKMQGRVTCTYYMSHLTLPGIVFSEVTIFSS